jgi:carbonic anhydrase
MTDDDASLPANDDGPSGTPLARLIAGVRQFRETIFPRRRRLFQRLAEGQNPTTLFITCADSRIVPELFTQTEPGEMFVCRNIGNVVPAYGEMLGGVSAVVEYACVALGVSDIIVCGHSDCGAMKALLDPDAPLLREMPTVRSWLRNAEAARSVVAATHPELEGAERVDALVRQNVRTQIGHLRTHPSVAARLATNQISLHGWVYDIETGDVRQIDDATGTLTPLGE